MKQKKLTSIILTLVMVLALLPSSMISHAQQNDYFEILQTKLKPILTSEGSTNAMAVFNALTESTSVEDIQKEIDKLDENSKTKLVNDYGFTAQVIKEILDECTDTTEITNLMTYIKDGSKDKVKDFVNDKYDAIYKKLPQEFLIKTDFSRFESGEGSAKRRKLNFLLPLVQEIYNGQELVTKEDEKIKILFEDKYIEDANSKLEESKRFTQEQLDVIKNVNQILIQAVEDKINSDNVAVEATEYLAEKLDIWKAPKTDGEDSNTGGSSGGGGGSSSSDSSSEEKGEVTIPDNAIKVKGNEVSFDKKELTKAIEKVLEKASKEIVVNIEIDDIKDLNAKISLPVESLKGLKGKEGSLFIKTKKLEITLPIEDLDLNNEKANIELGVKEISKDEVKGIVKDEVKTIAKVIDINLFKVDGEDKTNIGSKFSKKVKVGIDISDLNINKNKSVVLRINKNSTEIVGGKVKGNKIYANLEHFSKYAVVEREITFEDIQAHWAKDNIESMATKGVVKGYNKDEFRPNNKITRAEFAKLLVNALELDVLKDKGTFNDMSSHWAKDYVYTAYKAGLVKGADGKFNPNANITRAEMATMIGRALESDEKEDLSKFYDSNNIPSWAKEALSKAVAQGLIKGDNNLFRPNDNTTRAEAATVIYRLFNN
ncbi:S-layer homology domain-containing protein [Tepidibacter formicigenes]|jgi:hypothetical protein|uniref:S-layer homology domain-containing protein n=1 Tax=Tepidibacter formicigenes DSM 15518 TaxID=1123349 RepID=A0A1M6TIY1_9FIRM|nr:S-layer homology domain-containing protein [Tepidibacter formicigenes]SHK56931.1 S-layer homology domain-containing protein [Tepidibacter formicigenes DSM 15518]